MDSPDNDLVILILETGRLLSIWSKEIWVDVKEGPLQPDVEKI